VIEARGVTRRFGTAVAVDAVSLSLAAGEWVSLVGPSGCGKTTLLHLLGMLDRPSSGTIALDGEDGWTRPTGWRERARLRRLGFVFQDHNLLDHLTARDNVALPAWCLCGSRAVALARADEVLARLGLVERAHHQARTLSAGEAQRVAIARALINKPALVLADEPTGNLDSAATSTVLSALAEVVASGTALLLVTHDDEVAQRASRIVAMRDGRLV
jgi:putative ABC transport system ATP-binding protein